MTGRHRRLPVGTVGRTARATPRWWAARFASQSSRIRIVTCSDQPWIQRGDRPPDRRGGLQPGL